MSFRQDYLRSLPAVDVLLQEEPLKELAERLPRKLILQSAQEVIDSYRRCIMDAETAADLESLKIVPAELAAEAALKAESHAGTSLRAVINATGTILHTNLGRAPLPQCAVDALADTAGTYCNLEYSLETGERDSRMAHLEELLCELTGAEDALVVNNNAAAVFLVLNTLASGGEVIVSRGQLVEIGGSFRIPDVMSASGARLVEVGTTNKCYPGDYEAAINEHTALLLKVHTSNYRIMGFTREVERGDMVELGRRAGISVMEDLGSGTLLDLASPELPSEPTVPECLDAGVSVVTFSGDKLLGGPQAGIILGKKKIIDELHRNQILRALRVDKLTIAALENTLRLYFDPHTALAEVPVLRMLKREKEDLKRQATELQRLLQNELQHQQGEWEVTEGTSTVGGGAFPLAELPTYLVSFKAEGISPGKLARELRFADPPVVVRLQHDCLLMDVRTILSGQEEQIVSAMRNALDKLT